MSDLIVVADAPGATHGWATLGARRYRCALGRGGIIAEKREGDGGTPVGRFPLRQLYYRADKGALPAAPVPAHVTRAEDGWCDAPDHPAYNKAVPLPFAASHEKMWRDDHLYDLVLVIGHNDAPPQPYHGSAVFVHLAHEDYRPTEGCIAFSRPDLEEVLAALRAEDAVVVKGP
ncbi:L,D-transpeptidase [Dongia sp.]|uniref:L,D-transpeptidase family protein n=1 Tax=Dongia sp. TaxID=1977262 RepID=UPI0035B0B762